MGGDRRAGRKPPVNGRVFSRDDCLRLLEQVLDPRFFGEMRFSSKGGQVYHVEKTTVYRAADIGRLTD